jgi:ERCC4-type nuclease
MIIKIDTREAELITLLNTINNVAALTSAGGGGAGGDKKKNVVKAAAAPLSGSHTLQLSDDVSVVIPFKSSIMIKNDNDSELPHSIIVERLSVGDVWLCDGETAEPCVIIERKSLYDLAASIKDGRYNEQSFRLNQVPHHNHNILYMIEGDMSKYSEVRGRMSRKALHSAMFSLFYYKGFSVFRTVSIEETSHIIYDFADKYDKERGEKMPYYREQSLPISEEDGGSGGDVGGGDTAVAAAAKTRYSEVLKIKKEKSDNITPENIGEIMLCNIPGISAKIAIAVMSKYGGSFQRFMQTLEKCAQPNDPRSIAPCFSNIVLDNGRKIGPATVEKFYNYLCSPVL